MGLGDWRLNIVQKICTLVANVKMIPIVTSPGIGGGESKGEYRGGEIMYDIFNTL
jgi:hypothetical protein